MKWDVRPLTKQQQQGDGDAQDGYANEHKGQRVAIPKRNQPTGLMMSAHFANVQFQGGPMINNKRTGSKKLHFITALGTSER